MGHHRWKQDCGHSNEYSALVAIRCTDPEAKSQTAQCAVQTLPQAPPRMMGRRETPPTTYIVVLFQVVPVALSF